MTENISLALILRDLAVSASVDVFAGYGVHLKPSHAEWGKNN